MGLVKKRRESITLQGGHEEYEDLIAALHDANAARRRHAARALADHAIAAAALIECLQAESDLSVREVLFTSITRIGNETAVQGLVKCLASEDAQLRNEAIESLKALPERVAPIMEGLLANDDPDVRILAVNVLESLRHSEVESWLVTVIENDPVVNVCAVAVDLLSEVGTSACHGPLLRLKQRFPHEPYIQFAADLALKRIEKA